MPILIEGRKSDHIEIAVRKATEFRHKTTGFDEIELEYQCLPELNKKGISTATSIWGKKISAPLMVSGMTGGTKKAEKINKDIAFACQKLNLSMGLGSMRAMIKHPELSYTYQVRDIAPDIFLAGNIGAAQLLEYSPNRIFTAMKKVGANAIAVHMNAAQEAVQPEGDTNFKGAIKAISNLSKKSKIPVYVKEVGHGVSGTIAKKLSVTGIKAIDVQGAGGTSWVGIEAYRGNKELGELFWDFGIPTAASIIQCRKNFKGLVFASGGIRSGLDIVKGMALGAHLFLISYPLIRAQAKGGAKGVESYLKKTIEEIR